MKRFAYSCSILIGSLLGVFTLTGCSGNTFTHFPDTPTEVSPGAIQGSVFGGHAPIVGAHVYVLEAGQSGYASAAVSKLTHGDGTDSIGTYVLTNGSGFFNINGDYSCDYSSSAGGHPVYLAAAGGSPDQSLTATITSAAAVGGGINGHNPPYTISFSAANLFYVGQSITFPATGSPGALSGYYAVLNGTTVPVTSATQSTFVITSSAVSGSIVGTSTAGTATSVGVANPAIVNLAVLGLCPGVTNEFATTLSFVFMNEVSTVAAAEALGGFGTGPYNIGSSGTNLVGIQNAAVNAGQLYDIQGSNVTTTTPYDGEGHIARSLTPAGNGQVPQSTLDTLGNILASCVDSNNSGNSSTDPTLTGSPNASVNCSQLFTYATSNGVPFGSVGAGTIATDTATAAFNIAHYPAGAAAFSSGSGGFMQKIYALQASEATPFTPNLTTVPNDFTIAINYPNSLNALPSGTNYLGQAESLGVDGTGNIWFSAQTQKILFKWSPVGVLQNYTTAGYIFGYLSVDPSGDAWSGNANSNTGETEVSPTGVLLSAIPPPPPAIDGYNGPYNSAYTTVTDQYGDALIGSKIGTQSYLTVLFNDGQFYSQTNLHNTLLDPTYDFEVPPGADTAHGAIDSSSDLWINSEGGNQIDRLDLNAGHSAAGFPIVLGADTMPEFPGIDHANNAWIALQLSNTIDKVTPAGGVTNPTGSIYLNHPFGSAVDGIGNVWIANRAGSGNNGSIVEINGATSAAISPATNYTLGNVLNGSLNLAIDPSGDLWITNYYGSGSITELIGPVAPVATPLSAASGTNQLGTEP
jgi:hypothetical protein